MRNVELEQLISSGTALRVIRSHRRKQSGAGLRPEISENEREGITRGYGSILDADN